jgi:DNA-directed RNA polymerase specialized sigma24 family protein
MTDHNHPTGGPHRNQSGDERTADRRPLADGGDGRATEAGEGVIRYGSTADIIGEPEQVFARFGDEFVLLSENVPEWSVLQDHHDEHGHLHIDDLSMDVLGLLDQAMEDADIDELAADVADRTEVDEPAARLLILANGFELTPPEIADELDMSVEMVESQLDGLHDEYDIASVAATMQKPDVDIPLGRVQYGSTAEPIGEPEKLFARIEGEFALFPVEVLGWNVFEDTAGDGELHLEDVRDRKVPMIESKVEYVDLDDIAEPLAQGSRLDAQGAKILLLFEGFELDPPGIADELDVDEEVVVEHIDDIYDRYDEDTIVETVQDRHPDVPAGTVRVFVLAEGFNWPDEEIAEDLGVDTETVADRLETAREQYPELTETLQEAV